MKMPSGLAARDLGELGREVELVGPLGEVLADDLALEGALHAREHVLAGGVVAGHQVEALHALALQVFAHRHRRLVVLPRGREEVLVAEIARDLRRAGIGRDQDRVALVGHRLERGQQHVRPDVARDEVHLVLLDELLGLLLADVGLELVVLVDDLEGLAAHLAAEMLLGEFDRAAHVLADRGLRAGEGADETDLDRALGHRRQGAGGNGRQRRNCCGAKQFAFHASSPCGTPFPWAL